MRRRLVLIASLVVVSLALQTAVQGATTIAYSTDALGRMWQRSVGGAATAYRYRGLSEDISKVIPPSGSATTYAYSAGGPLAQQVGSVARLFLRDLHGDVVGLASTTGTIQGTRTFDPYGKPRTATGETAALGFQGAPTDASTGLVDMVTRHYAPTLGRFTTADQVFGNLMLPVSLNRFAYAAGNPVTYSDPDGMCANPSFCPAPTTSSKASAKRWYDHGEQLNEPSYGESSGYHAYVSKLYVQRPEIRPSGFRPQFFNRLPNLVRQDRNFRPPEDEGGGVFGFLHAALDVVGFIPVVGEVADGANAALYAVQGDWGNAAIYAGAVLVPTSGKVLRAGKELVEEGVEAAARRWRVGDDIWAKTAAGNEPAWSTVRERFWKNAASDPIGSAQWDDANLARMGRGRAPQRFNPDRGALESMELSHEPIPARLGGRELVPRWPQDHAAVDPYRFTGY